jgi:hypothetical protein
MTQQPFPAAEMAEAARLLESRHYRQAVEIYESLLRGYPAQMREHVRAVQNLQMHKVFLKHRVFFQILAQSEHRRGFRVNFSDYCFLDKASPDIVVSAKAVEAVDRYKGGCSSIESLKAGVPYAEINDSAHAAALIYCAHSVSADLVDLCLLGNFRSLRRVAELGAGAGIQAAGFAVMNPQVEVMHLFEQQEFMNDSIADIFEANGNDRYYLNWPLETPVDLFYSFRACCYLFSIDAYYEQIKLARAPKSWAIFDVNPDYDYDHQVERLASLFSQDNRFYWFGKQPHGYWRTVFESPKL